MKFILPLIILSQLAFLACDQDPLKGESENIRNGIPLSEKPKDDSDLIGPGTLIFGFNTEGLNFFEGKESEYVLEARTVGFTDPDMKVEFLNLPDGAVYDEATRTLSWTPGLDAVVGDDNLQTIRFKGRMSVKGGAAVKEKTFVGWVYRNEAQPVIEDVSFTREKIKEGQSTSFKVRVRDPESFDSKTLQSRHPSLQIVAGNSWQKGAGLGRINARPDRDPQDPEVWIFSGTMLSNEDLVSRDERVSIGFVAFSSFGKASPVVTGNFTLQNRVGRPVISWLNDQTWEVKAGEENELRISVFDPKVEGELAVTGFEKSCQDLDGKNGKVTCKCEASRSRASVVCSIRWKPEKQQASAQINFTALNSNPQDPNDVERTRARINMRVAAPGPKAAPQCPAPNKPAEEEEAEPAPVVPVDPAEGEEVAEEEEVEEETEDEEPVEEANFNVIKRMGGVA